ncbi:hypothetical protein [Nocardia asteroides]|uniref:hypothetical protein n=1 Tax=Nocardia asteroides TaxID=1824 RepID=UPI0033D8DA1C
MSTKTYTIRLDTQEHRLLVHLAKVLGTSAADLSRELLTKGIHQLLDPDEIDRRMELERKRLRAEAERILAEEAALAAQQTDQGGATTESHEAATKRSRVATAAGTGRQNSTN